MHSALKPEHNCYSSITGPNAPDFYPVVHKGGSRRASKRTRKTRPKAKKTRRPRIKRQTKKRKSLKRKRRTAKNNAT